VLVSTTFFKTFSSYLTKLSDLLIKDFSVEPFPCQRGGIIGRPRILAIVFEANFTYFLSFG
ncbi:hypothetical protein DX884_17150, partial [Vibrio fluvialis]|nr:hypothetical protein [Vibrio fluvialis]